jgi:hypothetical protein
LNCRLLSGTCFFLHKEALVPLIVQMHPCAFIFTTIASFSSSSDLRQSCHMLSRLYAHVVYRYHYRPPLDLMKYKIVQFNLGITTISLVCGFTVM